MMSKRGEDRQKTGSAVFPLPLLRNSSPERVVWTVAGFDPSGGAGITADLMTFAAHGLFGCSAITALTVQSTLGVFGWEPVAAELLRETLRRLEQDVPAAGIKIGMLGTLAVAEVISDFLGEIRERRAVVVFDPVLRSSSGKDLFPLEGSAFLQERLLPLTDWVTPNWDELGVLTGLEVKSLASAETAARTLTERFPKLGVVATGGDADRPTELLVVAGEEAVAFEGQRVETQATHGTGCAFSSALLARLVEGRAPAEAVRLAKAFVERALRHAPAIGKGRGPMNLLWPLRDRVGTLKG